MDKYTTCVVDKWKDRVMLMLYML